MATFRKKIAVIGFAVIVALQMILVTPMAQAQTCASGSGNYMLGFNEGCVIGLGAGDYDKRNKKPYNVPANCKITEAQARSAGVHVVEGGIGSNDVANGFQQYVNGYNAGCPRGYNTGYNRDPNAPNATSSSFDTTLIVPFPGFSENRPGDAASAGTFLAQYINAIYRYSIGIAALFAMAQIVIGGVEYVGSPGGISSQEDAKGRIKGAIFGLVLLIGAATILTTLNPKLLDITPGESPASQEIFNQNASTTAQNQAVLTQDQLYALSQQTALAQQRYQQLEGEMTTLQNQLDALQQGPQNASTTAQIANLNSTLDAKALVAQEAYQQYLGLKAQLDAARATTGN